MTISVPFNDTSRLFKAHEEELLTILSDIARSGWWLLGERTTSFSQLFAEYCGSDFCLPVANGTDALEIALRSVIQNPTLDDEIITVANAGGYTSTACYSIGVKPVYADVKKENQLVDIESLIRCLSPSVKAIVITHLYGAVVDIPEIRKQLSNTEYQQIPIVEDCAQAHGANLGECRVGSMGDLATFSFYPTKNLGALGDAGAVLTSDPERYRRLKQLHQYGWSRKYHVDQPYGKNSRMDEIQAGILSCLLPHLDRYNTIRKDIFSRYQSSSHKKIQFLNYSDRDHVAHLAVAMVDDRQEFMTFMKSKDIAVDIHYPILDCDQAGWKVLPKRLDEKTNLQVSRESIDKIVSIPCFPFLEQQEINHVCQALTEWESL